MATSVSDPLPVRVSGINSRWRQFSEGLRLDNAHRRQVDRTAVLKE